MSCWSCFLTTTTTRKYWHKYWHEYWLEYWHNYWLEYWNFLSVFVWATVIPNSSICHLFYWVGGGVTVVSPDFLCCWPFSGCFTLFNCRWCRGCFLKHFCITAWRALFFDWHNILSCNYIIFSVLLCLYDVCCGMYMLACVSLYVSLC